LELAAARQAAAKEAVAGVGNGDDHTPTVFDVPNDMPEARKAVRVMCSCMRAHLFRLAWIRACKSHSAFHIT
jgi:hypothetical protein